MQISWSSISGNPKDFLKCLAERKKDFQNLHSGSLCNTRNYYWIYQTAGRKVKAFILFSKHVNYHAVKVFCIWHFFFSIWLHIMESINGNLTKRGHYEKTAGHSRPTSSYRYTILHLSTLRFFFRPCSRQYTKSSSSWTSCKHRHRNRNSNFTISYSGCKFQEKAQRYFHALWKHNMYSTETTLFNILPQPFWPGFLKNT